MRKTYSNVSQRSQGMMEEYCTVLSARGHKVIMEAYCIILSAGGHRAMRAAYCTVLSARGHRKHIVQYYQPEVTGSMLNSMVRQRS
jgi:hypothetical protein